MAVSRLPSMHEGWNYLGFARRHLGRYDAALEAYERALKLKPGYADAIEYRGETYLGLDRLDDARKAYLDLFASSRQHADQLLAEGQLPAGSTLIADGGNGFDRCVNTFNVQVQTCEA